MRCLRGSLGVGELRRWAEHGRAEEKPEPEDRSPPRPTKGLGAQHLRFNLHAGVSVPGGLVTARERLLCYCARPRTAFWARGWQDLLPHQRYRTGAAHDADAVPGTACGVGTPTPPSAAAFLRGGGAAEPLAQPGRDGGPKGEAVHVLRSERPIYSARTSGSRHPRRGRDGATADREPRPVHVRNAAHALQARGLVRRGPASSCGGRLRFVEVVEDPGRARSELRGRNLPAEPPPLCRARSPDWG
jgi:hypothetical protein